MPTLEVMVEELDPDKVNEQFRLWLTSMPSSEFPISVLQNGMKMTIEPPKGLKSNLLRAFSSIDPDWFAEACTRSTECKQTFRKMLFGLCFFHALIQERCTYGPLGWNIPYQFSEPDRQICMMQLRMFLEENDSVPYAALRYTAAEANYGGRVTDVHDRRCINFLLTDFYCPEILKDDYKFSPSGVYYAPAYSVSLEPYIEYIRSLPINQMPEAFGLHANANLVAAISEAMRLLGTAAALQPRTGGGGGGASQDDVVMEAATKYLEEVRPPFDTEASNAKYPVDYNESMNTVLNQELLRFNKLIAKVRSTLTDVKKAVKGLVVMSAELEMLADGILTDRTPSVWIEVSYPSLKPMVSYVADLCARIEFFQKWIDEGIPEAFWLSGFYFTQSFLTGQLQNYARTLKLPIDTLIWNFKVLKHSAELSRPASGCLAYGIFVDGARWDDDDSVIAESLPKVLFSGLPTIHLTPCETSKDPTDRRTVYPSPLYKTSGRKGTLTTTGHSTNFVMTLLLPITKQHTEKYWAKRGVACLQATSKVHSLVAVGYRQDHTLCGQSRTRQDLAELVDDVAKLLHESCRELLVVLNWLVYPAIATLKTGVHYPQEQQLDARQLSESSDLEIHRHTTSRLNQEAEPGQVVPYFKTAPVPFGPEAFAGLQLKVAMEFLAAGVGAGLLNYNRKNFMFDKEQYRERAYFSQEMKVSKYELYREDIKDLTDLTVSKMDVYMVINVLQLLFCVMLFTEGMPKPRTTPLWLHWILAASSGSAVLYFVLSIWLGMHASIAAHSFGVRLLTQFVRLPVPNLQQIHRAAAKAKDYEALSLTDMLRIPVLQQQFRKLSATLGNLSFETPAEDTTGLDDSFLPEVYMPSLEETAALRHIQLYRELQANWQAYDAYCRVCMALGTNQLLQSINAYCLGVLLSETSSGWAAACCMAVIGSVSWLVVRLDVLVSWRMLMMAL
ncbi:Dnah1, partial [Symbiodinium sp. CCMP2456]